MTRVSRSSRSDAEAEGIMERGVMTSTNQGAADGQPSARFCPGNKDNRRNPLAQTTCIQPPRHLLALI